MYSRLGDHQQKDIEFYEKCEEGDEIKFIVDFSTNRIKYLNLTQKSDLYEHNFQLKNLSKLAITVGLQFQNDSLELISGRELEIINPKSFNIGLEDARESYFSRHKLPQGHQSHHMEKIEEQKQIFSTMIDFLITLIKCENKILVTNQLQIVNSILLETMVDQLELIKICFNNHQGGRCEEDTPTVSFIQQKLKEEKGPMSKQETILMSKQLKLIGRLSENRNYSVKAILQKAFPIQQLKTLIEMPLIASKKKYEIIQAELIRILEILYLEQPKQLRCKNANLIFLNPKFIQQEKAQQQQQQQNILKDLTKEEEKEKEQPSYRQMDSFNSYFSNNLNGHVLEHFNTFQQLSEQGLVQQNNSFYQVDQNQQNPSQHLQQNSTFLQDLNNSNLQNQDISVLMRLHNNSMQHADKEQNRKEFKKNFKAILSLLPSVCKYFNRICDNPRNIKSLKYIDEELEKSSKIKNLEFARLLNKLVKYNFASFDFRALQKEETNQLQKNQSDQDQENYNLDSQEDDIDDDASLSSQNDIKKKEENDLEKSPTILLDTLIRIMNLFNQKQKIEKEKTKYEKFVTISESNLQRSAKLNTSQRSSVRQRLADPTYIKFSKKSGSSLPNSKYTQDIIQFLYEETTKQNHQRLWQSRDFDENTGFQQIKMQYKINTAQFQYQTFQISNSLLPDFQSVSSSQINTQTEITNIKTFIFYFTQKINNHSQNIMKTLQKTAEKQLQNLSSTSLRLVPSQSKQQQDNNNTNQSKAQKKKEEKEELIKKIMQLMPTAFDPETWKNQQKEKGKTIEYFDFSGQYLFTEIFSQFVKEKNFDLNFVQLRFLFQLFEQNKKVLIQLKKGYLLDKKDNFVDLRSFKSAIKNIKYYTDVNELWIYKKDFAAFNQDLINQNIPEKFLEELKKIKEIYSYNKNQIDIFQQLSKQYQLHKYLLNFLELNAQDFFVTLKQVIEEPQPPINLINNNESSPLRIKKRDKIILIEIFRYIFQILCIFCKDNSSNKKILFKYLSVLLQYQHTYHTENLKWRFSENSKILHIIKNTLLIERQSAYHAYELGQTKLLRYILEENYKAQNIDRKVTTIIFKKIILGDQEPENINILSSLSQYKSSISKNNFDHIVTLMTHHQAQIKHIINQIYEQDDPNDSKNLQYQQQQQSSQENSSKSNQFSYLFLRFLNFLFSKNPSYVQSYSHLQETITTFKFDQSLKNKQILIQQNRTVYLKENESNLQNDPQCLKFALIDKPLDKNKKYIFRFYFESIDENKQMVIGICKKPQFAQQKFKFDHQANIEGAYLVSCTGKQYHYDDEPRVQFVTTSNLSRNRFRIEQRMTITCEVNPETKTIVFKNELKKEQNCSISYADSTSHNYFICVGLSTPNDVVQIKDLREIQLSQDFFARIKDQKMKQIFIKFLQSRNNMPQNLPEMEKEFANFAYNIEILKLTEQISINTISRDILELKSFELFVKKHYRFLKQYQQYFDFQPDPEPQQQQHMRTNLPQDSFYSSSESEASSDNSDQEDNMHYSQEYLESPMKAEHQNADNNDIRSSLYRKPFNYLDQQPSNLSLSKLKHFQDYNLSFVQYHLIYLLPFFLKLLKKHNDLVILDIERLLQKFCKEALQFIFHPRLVNHQELSYIPNLISTIKLINDLTSELKFDFFQKLNLFSIQEIAQMNIGFIEPQLDLQHQKICRKNALSYIDRSQYGQKSKYVRFLDSINTQPNEYKSLPRLYNNLRLDILINDKMRSQVLNEQSGLIKAISFYTETNRENKQMKTVLKKLGLFVEDGISEIIQLQSYSDGLSYTKLKRQPKILKLVIKTINLLTSIIQQEDLEDSQKEQIQLIYSNETKLIYSILKLICNKGFEPQNDLHIKFFNASIALFTEILEGGTYSIQMQFYNFFITEQRSHKFFRIIEQQVQTFVQENASLEQNQLKRLEFCFKYLQLSYKNSFDFLNIEKLFRFLQLLCENHNEKLQQYLRYQVKQKHSINILEILIQFLKPVIFRQKDSYTNQKNIYGNNYHFQLYSVSTVLQALTTITEMLQGPCLSNQLYISESEFFDIAVDILKINEETDIFYKRQQQEKKKKLKKRNKKKKIDIDSSYDEDDDNDHLNFESDEEYSLNGLTNVDKYCMNIRKIKDNRLQKSINESFKYILKECSDFYEEAEDVLNLTVVKDFEWIVQELKARIIQSIESCLEANDENVIFQRLQAKVPKELLMLNLIWTYDILKYNFGNSLEIQMDHFKSAIEIKYEDFKQNKMNEFSYEVSNIERGFKVYFLILTFTQNNRYVFSSSQDSSSNNTQEEGQEGSETNVLKHVLKKIKKMIIDDRDKTSFTVDYEASTQKILHRNYAEDYENAEIFFKNHTENIEILLSGQNLFKIYFPRLPIYDSVKKDTEFKNNFYQTIDRVSHSTKINSIIENYEQIHDKLKSEYEFLQKTKRFRFVYYVAINSQVQSTISFILACFQSLLILIKLQDTHTFLDTELDDLNSWEGTIIFILSCFQLIFAGMLISVVMIKQSFISLKEAKKLIKSKKNEGKNPIILFFQKIYIYCKYLLISDLNSTFYLLYTAVAITSFVFPVIQPLLMLVVFKKLHIARDILKAVTGSWKSLLVILFLFIIIQYYYALWVYYNYYEEYSTNCNSFWHCYVYIVDSTFKYDGGFISQAGQDDDYVPRTAREYFKVIFDFSYVMIIIVLTIQVIQGMIIDNFTQRRNNKEQQEHDMNKQCFICGIDRIDLDKKSKVMDQGFEYHVKNEHNLWNYIFYLGYITHKNPTDCSGYESYVLDCVTSGSIRKIKWLPIQRAKILEDDSAAQNVQFYHQEQQESQHQNNNNSQQQQNDEQQLQDKNKLQQGKSMMQESFMNPGLTRNMEQLTLQQRTIRQ